MSGVISLILALSIQLIIATDPCRYQTSKGVIDLTSVGRNDGTAAYQDQLPISTPSYRYSYNPCRPFSEGVSCQNVAACQVSLDGLYTYSLGTHDSVTWNDGSSFEVDPTVTYQYNVKTVRVMLECAGAGAEFFEALGETSLNSYTFRLRHRCACWDGCRYPPSPTTESTFTSAEPMNSTFTTESTTSMTTPSSETTTTATPITASSTIITTPSTAGDRLILNKGMIIMIILGLVYSSVFLKY